VKSALRPRARARPRASLLPLSVILFAGDSRPVTDIPVDSPGRLPPARRGNGEPAADADVRATARVEKVEDWEVTFKTDDSGEFRLCGLPPGLVNIAAKKESKEHDGRTKSFSM
jgi:hypothetical protein